MEKTLSIIKPDGVKKNIIGSILNRFEVSGFVIVNIKLIKLTKDQASSFYEMHKGKPFFENLVDFMTSGPCIPFVVQGENAITSVREMMGSTNPDDAACGTIRSDFADSIDSNIIHGSDSKESADREISFFFE
ncbi:MAG: nucleoside-diphosphate kinase [Thermodesulfobacteriota bacterium]|nr:nucleoside-diphosphate kinase [bacterium]MEC7925378.1 nucleoside-diphosphate kinase [Thermodesulfobacteriota bacterium]|tara:strand:- start:76 stop:474 length:399 start_codon:yes stop_codon:yes gene_type:complete